MCKRKMTFKRQGNDKHKIQCSGHPGWAGWECWRGAKEIWVIVILFNKAVFLKLGGECLDVCVLFLYTVYIICYTFSFE